MSPDQRVIPTKILSFQTICFLTVALFPALAVAQAAPTSLAVPSSVHWSGNFTDSEDGIIFEAKSANIISGTGFMGSNAGGDPSTGTYAYTKTGSSTGTISYTAIYTYDDGEGGEDTETEIGIVNLIFTSANGGTFTSSGTWSTNDGFSGSFTNGSGTFTYTPAPDVSLVNKKVNHTQTSASGPILLNYSYHAAIEGLAAPYASAPTLGLPAGASPASRIFAYDSDDERYDFQIAFTTGSTTGKQQLDAAFPNGNHTLTIGANSLILTLTADAYPSVPTITSSAGRWIGGKLVLTASEAATGFTLTGSTTAANGYRSIEIYDDLGAVNYFEWDNENGAAPAGPVTRAIPGGLLSVGGPYYCELEYDQVVDTDVSKISQFGTGFAMFSTMTAIEIMVVQEQRDLVGTWTTPTEDGGIAYITFLDDGTYHHTEDGTADDSGHPGLEVGTYTWNTETGALSTTPTVDQNGEWGLSHNAPDIRLFVNNGQLEVVEGEDITVLQRPAFSASAIVGSWVIISEGRPVVVVFLADGTYRHTEVGPSVGGGFSGMEIGTYVWNSTTGDLTSTPTIDQNGEWGLSDNLTPFRISVTGDQLTIIEGSAPLVFNGQRADATTALSAFLGDASVPYNQRGPLDDPDGDGISNLIEYALGLAPNSPNAGGLPTAAPALNPATGQNHLVMTMTLNANASGISNVPQVTSDLSGWNSGSSHIQTVSDTVSNGVRTLVVRDLTPIGSVSGRSRFMRLSVIQP